MTRNQLQYWANEETKRSNLAKEREANRSNLVNEDLKWRSVHTESREATSKEKDRRANVALKLLQLIPDTMKGVGSIL